MTRTRILATLLASAAIFPLAAPAMAGGTTPAPAEAAVVVPVTAPIPDWSGFYGGVTLGYGIGTYGNSNNFPGDGEGELNGGLFGGVVGYSFQNGNWVFGPELALSGANISGSESCVNPAFTCEVDFNYIAALRGNVGYLVSPDTLVFGTLGIASANVDVFTDDGTGPFGSDHDVTGYQFGIGVEWAAAQNTHVRATLSHYIFDDGDYQTDVLYSGVDMDATVFEVGVLFRF